MTGHDYDSSYFFPEDDDEEFEAEAPRETPEDVVTAQNRELRRTRADDIVDAVSPVEKVDPNVCRICGGTEFRVRGGMGGTRTRMCFSCRTESPLATIQDPVVSSNRSGQLPTGPYYGPPREKPSRYEPPHRVSATRSKK